MQQNKKMKKISLNIILTFAMTLLCIGMFSVKAEAGFTEVQLEEVSKPSEMEKLFNAGKGQLCLVPGGSTNYFSFTVKEKGWCVLNWSRDIDGVSGWSSSVSLYNDINVSSVHQYNSVVNGPRTKYRYYLEEGTYYIKVYAVSKFHSYDNSVYGYFLPDSKVLTVSENNTNCSTKNVKLSYVPKMAKSYMVDTIVKPEEIDWGFSSNAKTNLNDEYDITKNGEYSFKVAFEDAEWQKYPVCYSLTVDDLNGHPEPYDVTTIPATVDTEGKKTTKCTVCGEVISEEIIPKLLHLKWKTEDGKAYWYENGVRQGTYDDPKGVLGFDAASGKQINRGREICDMETNAWYWLDSVYDGAKACSKEVWVPYIYQEEAGWSEQEVWNNAYASGTMAQQVHDAIMLHGKEGAGKWVRYDANGAMVKGWYTVKGSDAQLYPSQAGNTYYYDPKTGLMAKGWTNIDGKNYYFNEQTGALQ